MYRTDLRQCALGFALLPRSVNLTNSFLFVLIHAFSSVGIGHLELLLEGGELIIVVAVGSQLFLGFNDVLLKLLMSLGLVLADGEGGVKEEDSGGSKTNDHTNQGGHWETLPLVVGTG